MTRQHVQAITTGKHKIQNDEVEFLGIVEEESFFFGATTTSYFSRSNPSRSARATRFVFHHEDAQLAFSFMHLGRIFSLQSCTVTPGART
jgi:hypothetical protein